MAAEALSRRDFWVGDWLVRPSLARIERGPDAVHITPRSMAVLVYLADAGGRVVSRNQLLDAVWPRLEVTQDALSQCIVELRKAFHDDAKRARVIETIPRLGVRLIGPVSDEAPAALQPHADVQAGTVREAAEHVADAPAPPGNLLARAGRRAASPPVAVTALVVATVGIAAFWFTQDSGPPWRDPLAGADFARVTDFIGAEEHAAISPDGRLVAFVSDRDGAWDVWLGQIGTGDFQNLTQGRVPELRNPAVRMLQFSPGGTDVRIWTKTTDAAGAIVDHGWTVPVVGGDLRRDAAEISELDWSPDGQWAVYHPSAPGDPLFIMAADDKGGGRQIYVAPPGIHCHFPIWSHDGKNIYFVRGFPPDEMDVWRIDANGGSPERLTQHNSRVSFPVLLDERTLLYLATAADGSGPWLYALDLQQRRSQRVKAATHALTSISASADTRRIVATEVVPTATLWRISLGDAMANAADVEQISLPTQRAVSPRIGPGFVVYRAPKAGTDGLWRREGSGAAVTELWSGVDGRVVAGPALTADGERLAFVAQRQGQARLHVINADGSAVRKVADELEVRGAPAWSPDGQWIAVAALRDGEPRLFKVRATGHEAPIVLGDDYALEPVWSPSGRFLVYTGRDVGTVMPLKAIDADGTPHALPELFLSRGSRRLAFLGGDATLVILKGALSHKEFWAIDLESGVERALTELGPGPLIGDFDVSHDGQVLVFDRIREESDIVRFDLAS